MARVVVLGSCPKALIRFRRHLLQALVARKHEVIACAPGEEPGTVERLSALGVRYHPVKMRRTSINPAYDVATLANLAGVLRVLRPDTILGYTIKPVIYGSLAARLAHVPHIFSLVEGLGYVFSGAGIKRRALGAIASRLYRLSFRFNEKVFVLNQDDADFFGERGLLRRADQCMVIPGIGIDLDRFVPAPLPKQVSFLFVGRLIRDKGIYDYIEAARIIKRRYPNTTFLLAGAIDSNPTAIHPEDLAAWQAEGTVEYLGELADIRLAIARSSVQVLPSYREGMPVSLMEAMAMGRAIVTTDAPGCREAVRDGLNGHVVPVQEPSLLARAMERFIVSPELIFTQGKAGRRMAEERFDVHKVNEMMMKAMNLY